MNVYKYEIRDGVADAIENNNSIGFVCDILEQKKFNPNEEEIKQSFAFLGEQTERQKDQKIYSTLTIIDSRG